MPLYLLIYFSLVTAKLWLRLRETHNALQLLVLFFFFFSFFYQPYPEYRTIRGKKLFYRQLIEYTVLEIQFLSLKYTAVISIRIFPFLSKPQAIQGYLE